MNKARASCWSITINNPTDTDEECIYLARQKGWKVEGQKEVGENGTPHYQLLVATGQVRFASVKAAFPRGHIEIARDKEALKKYVHKEETKIGELNQSHDLYPSQQKVWDMLSWWISEKYEPEAESISSGIELWNEDRWLSEFDSCMNDFIQDGYVLEGIAVNPQVRSGLKKFGLSIYLRSRNRNYGGYVRRQTDRQTDETDEVRDLFAKCFRDNVSLVDIPEDAQLSSCGTSTSEGTRSPEGDQEQGEGGTDDSCSIP